ncbi:hypothetical protein F0562_025818 [Nyssa sinensis]|uniref:Uncharacterized protein n=1 Tax=Nyssa sinensis TaxID=561372 RepID=A0A5J5B9S5_9ASTE|nr:hypothetical protein F0562_025818 [Nyssa sinensis]
MAVVSQTPNVRKIQGEIADMVGLELKEESESGRARWLSERLKQEKTILVILDDLWTKLNLEDIGIPCGNDHKGCNILLTSRDQDVCNQMNTQKHFPIEVLSPSEAWDLFKKIAGNFDDSPDLHNLAMEVAKECAGLPIAIITVATALKSESNQVWRDALQQFRNSTPQNIKGMHIDVYSKLQLSYDFLERKELKSCFLLCCLFPEDHDILIEDLVRYGMGLRLFKDIHKLEEARDRALALVDYLKARCLLLAGNVEGSVRMHDIIRDFALSVASKGEQGFLVKAVTELEEWPKFDTFANHTAIVLLGNKFHELPDRLDCPELNILVLGLEQEFSHSSSLKIPGTFFVGMKMMRVLVMRYMSIPSLPPSIQCLKNLRTLCLEHCMLSDISFIGELKEKLEILSFCGSDIEELPREIGQLTHLRLLDLSDCTNLKLIPLGVISSLSHLEDLYMINSFKNWEVDDKDTGKRNASLAEMKSLSQIRVLEMHIPDIKLFPKDLLFGNLIKFKISIGPYFDSYWYREICENSFQRIFKFNLDQSITLYSGFHMLLKRVEYFVLEGIEDLGNVLCDSKTDGFSSLKWLKVQRCGGNEYLIDTTGWASHNNIFRILERLELDEMQNLKNLWKDPSRRVCLRNLKVIEVRSCSKLKNLFSQHTARDLGKLQELSIRECGSLEEIFANDGGAAATSMGEIVFQNLNSMTLSELPNLTTFLPPTSDGSLDSTTHPLLFNDKVVFPSLENLYLSGLNKVKEIWRQQLLITNLQNLKLLKISKCNGLRNLFPRSASEGLIRLQELEIDSCEIMKDIVANESGEEEKEATDVIVFPQLRTLTLKNLPELVSFYQGITYNSEKLTIEDYPKTKAFGSKKQKANDGGLKGKMIEQGNVDAITEPPLFNEKVVVPSLENLYLSGLNKVKEIWRQQFPIANLQNLKLLKISKCNGLRNLFPRSASKDLIQLQELEIDSCEIMKDIVANESGEEEKEANDVIVFPQLWTLTLKNLPELVSFYQGINYTSEKLTIEDYPKTTAVGSKKQKTNDKGFKGKMIEQGNVDAITEPPLFNEKVLFPTLEEVTLTGLNKMRKIWHRQPSVENFYRLKCLEIRDCDLVEKVCEVEGDDDEEDAANTLIFSKLRTLILENLQEFVGIYTIEWLSLEILTIKNCPKITTFPNSRLKASDGESERKMDQESNLIIGITPSSFFSKKVIFPSLENLYLSGLNKVKEIWHPQHLNENLQNLKSLKIVKCSGLRNVFQGLFQLQELETSSCEIVAKERGEEEKEANYVIVFPQLRTLKLKKLPELLSFYQGINYTSEKLTIEDIPKQKTFGTEKPKKNDKGKMNEQGNLGAITQSPLFSEKVLFPTLENVTLTGLNKMRKIWHEKLPTESFYRLKCLKIRDCDLVEKVCEIEGDDDDEEDVANTLIFSKLRTLILENLPEFVGIYTTMEWLSLEILTIKNCPKITTFPNSRLKASDGESERKIDQESNLIIGITPSSFFSKKVLFPCLEEVTLIGLNKTRKIWHEQLPDESFCRLKCLRIRDCHNLVTVIPPNLIQRLQNFQEISIESCDLVEQVCEVEGDDDEEDAANTLIFSKLCALRLENLPEFVGIYTTMEWLSLEILTIENCPKITTFPNSRLKASDGESERKMDQESNLIIGITPSSFFSKKVLLPNLKELRIGNLQSLKEVLLPHQFLAESFSQLRILWVGKCDKLLKVIPSNLLQQLQNLEELTVTECESVEEVIQLEGANVVVLSQLRELNLRNLPKSVEMWWNKDCNGILSCPNLGTLVVSGWGRGLRTNPMKKRRKRKTKQSMVKNLKKQKIRHEIQGLLNGLLEVIETSYH